MIDNSVYVNQLDCTIHAMDEIFYLLEHFDYKQGKMYKSKHM